MLYQGPNELQVRVKLILLPLRGRIRCVTTLVRSCREPEYPTHEWDFQDRPIPIRRPSDMRARPSSPSGGIRQLSRPARSTGSRTARRAKAA